MPDLATLLSNYSNFFPFIIIIIVLVCYDSNEGPTALIDKHASF